MKCQKCGTEIKAGEVTCAICGTLCSSTAKSSTIAWENSDEIGIINSFFKTAYSVIVKPAELFEAITNNSSLFKAILFALVAGSVSGLGEIFWQTLSLKYPSIFPPSIIANTPVKNGQIMTYAPIVTIARVVILTLYIHFMLFITKARKQNIVATAVAVCYIQAVSLIAIIIPVGNISALWGFFLVVLMGSRVHKISTLRSFVTIMLPIILIVAIFITVMILLFGTTLFLFAPMLKLLLQ